MHVLNPFFFERKALPWTHPRSSSSTDRRTEFTFLYSIHSGTDLADSFSYPYDVPKFIQLRHRSRESVKNARWLTLWPWDFYTGICKCEPMHSLAPLHAPQVRALTTFTTVACGVCQCVPCVLMCGECQQRIVTYRTTLEPKS